MEKNQEDVDSGPKQPKKWTFDNANFSKNKVKDLINWDKKNNTSFIRFLTVADDESDGSIFVHCGVLIWCTETRSYFLLHAKVRQLARGDDEPREKKGKILARIFSHLPTDDGNSRIIPIMTGLLILTDCAKLMMESFFEKKDRNRMQNYRIAFAFTSPLTTRTHEFRRLVIAAIHTTITSKFSTKDQQACNCAKFTSSILQAAGFKVEIDTDKKTILIKQNSKGLVSLTNVSM